MLYYFTLNKKLMQTKTYILTKSMLLIITYAGEFPSFSKCHEYSQTVFDLHKHLTAKVKIDYFGLLWRL